ncbi:MAG: hypothetical protein OK454_10465 [Thaumarchaeota archaeon]|nr:hypothetical protein [Nitrososphaerota archaeon]
MTLSQPKGLGVAFGRVFFGIGLTLPVLVGVLSVVYSQVGLINRVEIYPWDQVLQVVFLLALLITPESICVYFFQNKIINSFLARMAFIVLVIFLYANYLFIVPPTVYTFLPETPATLLWAFWPPIVAIALGFLVGRIESKQVFMTMREISKPTEYKQDGSGTSNASN